MRRKFPRNNLNENKTAATALQTNKKCGNAAHGGFVLINSVPTSFLNLFSHGRGGCVWNIDNISEFMVLSIGHFLVAYNCLWRKSIKNHLLFVSKLLSAEVRPRNLATRSFNVAKNGKRGTYTHCKIPKCEEFISPKKGIFGNSLTIVGLIFDVFEYPYYF